MIPVYLFEDPASNPNAEEFPHETQSAQCTITAGEVQASAQATISKKLEGVCGSSSYFVILIKVKSNYIYICSRTTGKII